MVRDVLYRRGTAGHVDVVVVAPDQPLTVEVEGLFGAMRRDGRRKLHAKTTPGLGFFLPWLDFLRLDSWQGEEERRVQIGPHRVAGKVRQLQVVPRRLERMSLERVPRREPL